VHHYECLEDPSPLSHSLDTGQSLWQHFVTTGSLITRALLLLRSDDSVDRSVRVGIYTQPTTSAAYLRGEQTVNAKFVPSGRPEAEVTFPVPITTVPGVALYLVVTSIEGPISVFLRQLSPGTAGCLIATIEGLT
jgi:hypothetical protein